MTRTDDERARQIEQLERLYQRAGMGAVAERFATAHAREIRSLMLFLAGTLPFGLAGLTAIVGPMSWQSWVRTGVFTLLGLGVYALVRRLGRWWVARRAA